MGRGRKFGLCVTDLDDSSSFEEECVQESIEIYHTIGFQEIAVYDNTELLKSLDEELSNEKLLQLETFSYAKELDVIDTLQVIEHHVNVKEDLLACLKSAEDWKEKMSKVESGPCRMTSFIGAFDGMTLFYRIRYEML